MGVGKEWLVGETIYLEDTRRMCQNIYISHGQKEVEQIPDTIARRVGGSMPRALTTCCITLFFEDLPASTGSGRANANGSPKAKEKAKRQYNNERLFNEPFHVDLRALTGSGMFNANAIKGQKRKQTGDSTQEIS
ncbi:hypothetical protein QE152_g8280 [Popillia japonica]|uniref:Uncharacterized protein n=1 Tax=Popillia japonica TaxID=7064 RepID=A0AAW1M4S4_POPJA